MTKILQFVKKINFIIFCLCWWAKIGARERLFLQALRVEKYFTLPHICRERAFGAPLISALTKTVMELEFFNVTRFKDIFSLFLKNRKCDKKKVDIFDCVMHLKHDSAKWGYFSSFQICKPFFKDIYLCFLINFSLNWYSWSFLLRERKFVFFTFFPDFFGFIGNFQKKFRP